MQNLTRLISELKKKSGVTEHQLLNVVREYLQVLILKAIYQTKYGKELSFIGGTCLRICYDLKRFSEDLDFALDRKIDSYSFSDLNDKILNFLKNTDFEVEANVSEDKIVQKSFIKVANILHFLGLSPLSTQKLHIKLKVDTRPVAVKGDDIETFFVTKFNENFPILKHTEETMFAGKISAVLNRSYTKGRDFYDLLWYLNRKIGVNFAYLNKAMRQADSELRFKNKEDVIAVIGRRIDVINVDDIMKDIGRFLEDPGEEAVMQNYKAAFRQIVKRTK